VGQTSSTAPSSTSTSTCPPPPPTPYHEQAAASGNGFDTAGAGGGPYYGDIQAGQYYYIDYACYRSPDISSNNGWWYHIYGGHWVAATVFYDQTDGFGAPHTFGGGSSNCN
jgi:hypothetical protein